MAPTIKTFEIDFTDPAGFRGFNWIETPLGHFFRGQFTNVSLKNGQLSLTLDGSDLQGGPSLRLVISTTKNGAGEIVLGSFSLRADGKEVATGDFDGLNTGAGKAGDFGRTSFSIWDGNSFKVDWDGNDGQNVVYGTNNNDRFLGRGGDDAFSGRLGNDLGNGGSGDDELVLGAGNDRGIGGNGHDFISTGFGHDVAKGGGGNDILLFRGGRDKASGGPGTDIFFLDTNLPDSGGVWDQKGQVTITNTATSDVFVFGNAAVPTGVVEPGAKTLADLDRASINGMSWKMVKGNLQIQVGDQTLILKDTRAGAVDLDRLVFTSNDTFFFSAQFVSLAVATNLGFDIQGGAGIISPAGDNVQVDVGGATFQTWAEDSWWFVGG